MTNRKRGAILNFAEPLGRGMRVAHHQTGHISTSNADPSLISRGVLTNGKIISVSDTVTIAHQTVPIENEPSPK